MSAMREKDQADFDLDRFIDMFDEAMTSSDPRVIETLRSLMMIVTLTRSETRMNHGRNNGPLRRLYEDLNDLNRSMQRMHDEIRQLQHDQKRRWDQEVYPDWNDKYTLKASAQLAKDFDDTIIAKLSSMPPAGKLYK